ncbi:MAG TPA: hypothetical protein PL048_07430 [Leptospiraceae bacterium]|nr:hypothetical protein [Leptospiraceae bacterium]HNF16048.1 hypothetical protein [Leptospiraceae bacterium]HNH06875.1 hypothetical protein [Leptospiraceae bacterium]HNM05853.1 hypothetical protein [Leptospiraceae bacterium]HNN06516.1 hypothetical protein [Leptospiraceae bacterium]
MTIGKTAKGIMPKYTIKSDVAKMDERICSFKWLDLKLRKRIVATNGKAVIAAFCPT